MNDDDAPSDVPAVEIFLRVPGPWASPEAFDAALPDGYRLGGDGDQKWLYTPAYDGGDACRTPLYVHPFDAEFVDVFAGGTGRELSVTDREGIATHAALVCPVFPGGSERLAIAALRHTAALIRAGGFGVFVDNNGLAHGSDDWLALVDDADDGAFFGLVNVYGNADRLWSIGMHLFGHRDATLLDRSGDDHADDFTLRNFLRDVSRSGEAVHDGDWLDDVVAGETMLAKLIDDDEVAPDHPMHNPFGRYVLERRPDIGPPASMARGPA